MRPKLKKKFFQAINGVEIHFDADFRPLTPEKIVRLSVQTLAKKDADYETYTPLFANLHSNESKPIQTADIIAGAIRTMIEHGIPLNALKPLPFDLRKNEKIFSALITILTLHRHRGLFGVLWWVPMAEIGSNWVSFAPFRYLKHTLKRTSAIIVI